MTDFEDDWDLLKPPADPSTKGDSDTIRQVVARAAEATRHSCNPDAVKAVETFMVEFLDRLNQVDTAGMIAAMIQGQDLDALELKRFVQSLPLRFLVRVTESALNSGTGIHALCAIEVSRRSGHIKDYHVIDELGRVKVRFQHHGVIPVEFVIREGFRFERKPSEQDAQGSHPISVEK